MTSAHLERLIAAEDIAQQVGIFAAEQAQRREDLTVSTKGPQDFVSTADREAEHLARRLIAKRFPGDSVIGEESGGTVTDSYWIIDPIDGTTNFLSGMPLWAVSIAYIDAGEPVVGALSLPVLGELVAASSDSGLRLNRLPIPACASRTGPRLAGIGRNLPWLREGYRDTELRLESAGYSLVSLGSCATELAFVALGRLDGYVQCHVNNWDIAAGVVACRAAGIIVEVTPSFGSQLQVLAGTSDFRTICKSNSPTTRSIDQLPILSSC